MNTTQINDILESDEYTRSAYRGTLARDEFVEGEILHGWYVCNLDNSDRGGSHWVAIEVPRSGSVQYFDSYGIQPLYRDLSLRLMTLGSKEVRYSTTELQSIDTTVCGFYCIVFILLAARGYDMQGILDILTEVDDTHTRDHAVKRFVMLRYGSVMSGRAPNVHIQSSVSRCEW